MSSAVRPLVPADEALLRAHLEAGLPEDAYLLDALDEGGVDGFLGAFASAPDGAPVLRAVAFHRRYAVSAGSHATTDGLVRLAPLLRARGAWSSIIGPETSCGSLVSLLSSSTRPRVNRLQAFMACREPLTGDAPVDLRPARLDEVEELVPLVAAYRREDGLTTSGRESLDWIASHVTDRIHAERLFVLRRGGRIVFTGAFNFLGPSAAGLGGIYTLPDERGRGLGSAGTAWLARHALERTRLVTLHVALANRPAIRCYERAGFERTGTFRLVFR